MKKILKFINETETIYDIKHGTAMGIDDERFTPLFCLLSFLSIPTICLLLAFL